MEHSSMAVLMSVFAYRVLVRRLVLAIKQVSQYLLHCANANVEVIPSCPDLAASEEANNPDGPLIRPTSPDAVGVIRLYQAGREPQPMHDIAQPADLFLYQCHIGEHQKSFGTCLFQYSLQHEHYA